MFSLIVSIIAIVLVVAIAAATVYWGGSSLTGSGPRATAEQLINQGGQIVGAASLYQSDSSGQWPATPQTLANPQYLATFPVPQKAAYDSSAGTPAAADWTWYEPGSHHLTIKDKISQAVCLAVDQIYGMATIPANLDPNYIIQCYGASAPYTFYYDPASVTQQERQALAPVILPPGSGGSVSTNSNSSVSQTPPGTPSGGNNSKIVYPALPNPGNVQSPLPVIVFPNTPYITPPNWTSGGNAPNEPTPPRYVPANPAGYWASNGNWTTPTYPTPLQACQALVGANAVYNPNGPYAYGHCELTTSASNYGNVQEVFSCPDGRGDLAINYNGSTIMGCDTSYNPSAFPLPADGKCEMTLSGGNLAVNSRDSDCSKVSTTQPAVSGTTAYGTAVWANHAVIMTGTDATAMAYNADGSVTLKHCLVSNLNACFQ